jgi:hypothetical protein
MKKVTAVLVAMVLFVCLVSLGFAADMKKGTIKSVDAKAGTMVFTADGKDETLKADKGVDLTKCKAGDAVEISVEKDMVKEIKAASAAKKPKAAVGC